MNKDDNIFVAGHKGLVGSAIVRALEKEGYNNIIMKDRKEVNLLDQTAVNTFFAENKIDYIFMAAAKVGGIMANKQQKADFIYENLQVQNNIIHSAYVNKVKKLLFLGSSCIYPRLAPQPLKEEYLLTGPLEETNDAYAIAKIAGIIMCKSYNEQYGTNFISAMPTNLYGYNDNFDLETSHVLPALIRKFHDAKVSNTPSVEIWGSGSPLREFLFVDDLADALVFMMNNYDNNQFLNVGTGEDISIRDLAMLIRDITGFTGEIKFDKSKPDGTPKKQLDVSRINKLGWKAKTTLEEGLRLTYEWYVNNVK